MKTIFVLTSLVFSYAQLVGDTSAGSLYDPDFVQFTTETLEETDFHIVELKRKDRRVRLKYFACGSDEQTVEERYNEWSTDKNVILYSSGAYMSELGASTAGIVGLTIDEGQVTNDKFSITKMNALVLVYPNGDVSVRDADQPVVISNDNAADSLNLRNAMHMEKFLDWAESENVTLFQTHLLLKNGNLKIAENSSDHKAERRFFINAIGEDDEKYEFIVHIPEALSLYEGTVAIKDHLEGKAYQLESIVNLDTGAQDVFKMFDAMGDVNEEIQGRLDVTDTHNLMVYYFE